MKKVWIAWLIVAGGVAIFTVLAVVAPNQPMKSADTWSTFGVSLIGMLVMLPVAGIAVLVTLFSLVDHLQRARPAHVQRSLGLDHNATGVSVGPSPLLRWIGWLIAGITGLGMLIVMIAGFTKLIGG